MHTSILNSLTVFLVAVTTQICYAQSIPTDNPYRTRYGHTMPPQGYHWTDSIRWNNVVNIADFSGLVNRIQDPQMLNDEDKVNDWYPAFVAAQNALVASGGGVLFFPKLPQRYDGPGGMDPGKDSAYYFSDHLKLKSNVILRGETPSATDARLNTFCPPTYFQFPAYPYSGTFNVPNSVSFKEITVDTTGNVFGRGKLGFKNIGLVYIDVNSGRIAAHPSFRDTTIGSQIYGKANERPRNVLILGVRSNNVAIPDLNIPNAILPASRPWHRWPWMFGSNIDVYVAANCIIAGCRLNDYQNNARNNLRRIENASFEQSGYVPNPWNSGSTPCFPTPSQAKFNYNKHYGIFLNRLKKSGYNEAKSFQSNASPAMEPDLYAPGNLVLDNWVYKESFVGIQAAGLGLVIKGNVVKDLPQKETAIGPTGSRCLATSFVPTNTPTYENRGIDFCGWNVLIDSNDVEVYRIKLLPSFAYSGDGEGWYFQGPSGSTARNITISNNISRGSTDGLCGAINNTNINKAFNGFANTVSVQNVKILNNDFGGFPFKVRIDGPTAPNYTLRGFKMFNNSNIHSIEIYAKGCGDSSFLYNNSRMTSNWSDCGFPDLRVDCFTSLNSVFANRNENSNPGFTTYPSNPGGDDRNGCSQACPTNNPVCGFPMIAITDPASAGFYGNGEQLIITANYVLESGCTPDSITLFKQAGQRVQTIPSSQLQPGNGEVTFTNYFAPFGCTDEYIYVTCYQGDYFGQSSPRIVSVCTGTAKEKSGENYLTIFPNPSTNGATNIRLGRLEGKSELSLFNGTGKKIRTLKLENGETEIKLSHFGLPAGIYTLRLESGPSVRCGKLVIR